MMTIHLFVGAVVVLLTLGVIVALLARRPSQEVDALARWAIGLLVVQITTGVFLFTATEEGPGPWHVALPLVGLAIAAGTRALRSDPEGRERSILGPAYVLVALAAMFGLYTGLTAG